MCGDNGETTWKLNILVAMDWWSPNFDDRLKTFMGILVMEIIFPIYYVLHK